MKIAIVSRGDRFTGGASRGADELAHWLIEAGHSVTHFCREFQQVPAPFQRQLYGPPGVETIVTKLHGMGRRLGYQHFLPFEYYGQLRWMRDSFDLFHFHDLSAAVSYETLVLISRHKPVVFTVHDCSAFTGGCIYPMGCEKFETRCGPCPQLGQWPLLTKFDHTGTLQQQRRHAAAQSGIQYVFPSKWIERQMTATMPLGRNGAQISNAIDQAQIKPTSKSEARSRLGLPRDRPVILLSMNDLTDERKGVRYAIEAIRQVTALAPVLITTGHADSGLTSELEGIAVHSFGHIRAAEKLALIYSAADVYLFTSLADNCPYTVLETMASGTATVAFATGGVPELVVSEETGILVPVLEMAQLVAALRRALLDKELTQRWGNQARRRIESHFSKQRFMEKMCSLYETCIQECKSSS